MVKHLWLFTTLLWLAGCVATPDKRFASTLDQVRSTNKIAVVVDSMVLTDIEGRDLGFNIDKNASVAFELSEALVSTLAEKGYEATVEFVGSGYQADIPEEAAIYYSENWKSTGEPFPGNYLLGGESLWSDAGATKYFNAALMEGRGANWTPPSVDLTTSREKEKRAIKLGLTSEMIAERQEVFANSPDIVNSLETNVILFVKYADYDVSTTKKFGIGLLTGGVSLAASGGTAASVTTIRELGPMELVAFDAQSNEVLWAHEVADTSIFPTPAQKVAHMLGRFPKR